MRLLIPTNISAIVFGYAVLPALYKQSSIQQVQLERDELYSKFLNAVHEIFQKTGFKNLILEKKLCLLEEVLEKKDVQLSEVLASCNIDPNALSSITRKIEVIYFQL